MNRAVRPLRTPWWRRFFTSMVLPTPFGPTRTTLVASLTEASENSSSMSARSMRLGQAQSKSAMDLKAPMRALVRRPSEGAALAFAVFDVDDTLDPGLGEQGVVLGGESVEPGVAQALAQGVGFTR